MRASLRALVLRLPQVPRLVSRQCPAGPAPVYASRSPIENRIGALYREYVKPERVPHDEAEKRNEIRAARTRLTVAQQKGDTDAEQEARSALAALHAKPYSGNQSRRPVILITHLGVPVPPGERAVSGNTMDGRAPRPAEVPEIARLFLADRFRVCWIDHRRLLQFHLENIVSHSGRGRLPRDLLGPTRFQRTIG
jgi:hypothetical protein